MCSRLHEHLVQVLRVTQPDLREVDLGTALAAEPRVERGARDVEARLREREADVVRRLDEPDDVHRSDPAHVHLVAEAHAPGPRECPFDEQLRAGVAQVAPGHDRVPAARTGIDHLGDRIPAVLPAAVEVDADVRDLEPQRVPGDIGERGDPLRHGALGLVVEADDDVRQGRRPRRAVKAGAEPVRDDDRGGEHRRRRARSRRR